MHPSTPRSTWHRASTLGLAGVCWLLIASNHHRAEQLRPLDYFPPADTRGGWRTAQATDDVRRAGGIDRAKLDATFEYVKGSSRNGGLLVVRNGWLVYEQYFGLGHREAIANLASCGKSVTSIAVGILLAKRPDLFPQGLDQRVFTPQYLPPEAFPLTDPRKAEITACSST